MLDKKKYAFYLYGITNVKENDRSGRYGDNVSEEDIKRTTNPNLLIIEYGEGKKYFVKKSEMFQFVKAVIGENFLKAYEIDERKFYDVIDKIGYVEAMKELLLGRGIIFVTKFKNYFEFSNGGQNAVVGVTGIDLDGEYIANDESELFCSKAGYDDIYRHDANEQGESKVEKQADEDIEAE